MAPEGPISTTGRGWAGVGIDNCCCFLEPDIAAATPPPTNAPAAKTTAWMRAEPGILNRLRGPSLATRTRRKYTGRRRVVWQIFWE